MSDEVKPTEVKSEATTAAPSPAVDQKISLNLDEFKAMMRATVEDVLKSSKTEEARKQAEEYNAMIAESVKASQAQLLKPNTNDTERNLRYVEGVLEEDTRARFNSPEGKAYYNDKDPESFKKAKIKLLHHIGYEPKQIAEELKEII